MNKIILILLTLMLTSTVQAKDKKPPTLKSVMQGLSTSFNTLNDGILYENYRLIIKGAKGIASHPKPKSQLPTVIKTLNVRMLKFKGFDSIVHDNASDIIDLAKARDLDSIVKKQAKIMQGCINCHNTFRAEISEALSNK